VSAAAVTVHEYVDGGQESVSRRFLENPLNSKGSNCRPYLKLIVQSIAISSFFCVIFYAFVWVEIRTFQFFKFPVFIIITIIGCVCKLLTDAKREQVV